MNETPLTFRPATRADVPAIVRLLAADDLGRTREDVGPSLPDSYHAAFDAIARDGCNELVVVEADGEVIGTLQLTVIPSLTYRGGSRAQIEAVRVDERLRGQQVGQRLIEWAIARARERGCHMVQLTTDKRRKDAHRFYQRLGFAASHEGMKLHLPLE
jgi:GNAT superfamily N-acetyltransferase